MAAKYTQIKETDLRKFLEDRGFIEIFLPGTTELVYAKTYKHFVKGLWELDISLRVYTSISDSHARNKGEDAIRVVAVTRRPVPHKESRPMHEVSMQIIPIGTSRRVHRVAGWRKNLTQRLDNWEELLQPACPICGAPMRLITMPSGVQFYGCVRYPDCKGTRKVENE